ncbi:MAG TPA: TonB-dependent receptor, partial [Calditrichia bacterium]|nr:TonB-dependent receptor [Calditrichia bacterium]
IIDVPFSVFRVDSKELPFGKKISARDVLADVPGLLLQSRYGSRDLRISLRGYGTRSNSGARGIRVLQDGFPQTEPDGETILDDVDFTSLGGVEVVKGNLSSLYANAPGGVINFTSDLYFPQSFAGLISQVGSYGWRLNGMKLGLANPHNRMLMSYNYSHHDGYREHSAEYQHLANFIYETYPDPGSSLTILGAYLNGLSRQPGSLTREEFEADPFQAYDQAVSQDFRRTVRKGRLGIRYKQRFDEDKKEVLLTGYGSLAELKQADNLSHRISTRYSLGGQTGFTNRSVWWGKRENTLSAGMDFAYQAGPVDVFENVGGVRGISVNNNYRERLSNLGFFLSNRLQIIPERLDFLLTGRFDRNSFRRDILIPFGFTDSTRVFQKTSPKIALNYKLLPSLAFYTSYGLSYEFPALSELANTPFSSNIRYTINPDLGPQKSRNLEVGLKGNFINPGSEVLRKVFFDLTWFNYRIRNEIIPFVINQQTYYRNAARTNRQGLEIGMKSEPVDHVELAVNYVYMNFKYDDYTATIYGPSGTSVADYGGNTVPSIPGHIFNLILNVEFEITEGLEGLLQWDCDDIGRMFVDDANSETADRYFYGNVMAGLSFRVG